MISRGKLLANLAIINKKDTQTVKNLCDDTEPKIRTNETEIQSSDEIEDFDPIEDEFIPPTSESESSSDCSPTFSPVTPKVKPDVLLNRNRKNQKVDMRLEDDGLESPIEVNNKLGKRRRNVKNWKCNVKKHKFNSGQHYKRTRGADDTCRSMGPPCDQKCRVKCLQKFSLEDRKTIFAKFWELENKTLKWNFILTYSETNNKKVTKVGSSRRNCSRNYFFQINGIKQKVCLKMFLSTLGINYQWVETAHKKIAEGEGVVTPDQRGKHARKVNEVSAIVRENVREHINALEKLPSHYARSNTSRQYIDNVNSISALHRIYKHWCTDHQIENMATERQYRDIFVGEFNISLFRPKKDQCNLCISKNLNFEDNEENTEHNKHIALKKKARELKESDKEDAIKSGGEISCIFFDFQKILTCPKGQTNIFYYLRKLSSFNFTVYSLENRNASCYVWDETMGKRGANEVMSCLSNYMETAIKNGVKEFRFWSDNCPGQNKNQYIFSFYAWFSLRYKVDICHRFLEKGHTQNEADSVHSTIETACKNKIIYVPAQWFLLVRQAKIKGQPYNVIEMSYEDFFDLKKCANMIQNKKSGKKDKIYWTKVREVKITSQNPYEIYFKYDFDDCHDSCLIIPTKNLKKREKFLNFGARNLYSGPLPISEEKKSDLRTLCQGNFIPTVYKSFFNNLPSAQSVKNTEEESDNE